jgi:NADPH:quinone reductase-like Zn-dependent oxidoreductase
MRARNAERARMKAVVYDRFGDESVLAVQDLPEPMPLPHEVQVQVACASLNPVDYKLRDGMLRLLGKPRLPAIAGLDFAGRVGAVGTAVHGFQIGQRVFGSVELGGRSGACAQTLVVGTDRVVATPPEVGDDVAACLPVAAGTAVQALGSWARLQRGQSVLVTGASGGVGAAAVQWARSVGAVVTGVCGTGNVDYVRGLGAERVVDYRKADWRALGERWDVIFDAAAASSFGPSRASLAPEGMYINTMPRPGLWLASKFAPLWGRQRAVPFMLKLDPALLTELARQAQWGVLVPRIARTVDLAGVAVAMADLKAGRVHGKVCVRVAG